MKTNITNAAPAASAIELKNEKSAKAKRILIGTDVHLRGYQAARKVDNGVIGVVKNFRSEKALLLHVEKQCERAEQVVVVYEAGPLGFTLYRKLIWPRKRVQAVAQFWLLFRLCKGLVTLSWFLLFFDLLVCFNSVTIRCAQGRNPA